MAGFLGVHCLGDFFGHIESVLGNRDKVYHLDCDHLAGGIVQQGLSVAIGIAPWIHVEAQPIVAIR